MPLRLSLPFESTQRKSAGFQVKSIDLYQRGARHSSIVMLDDFKVSGNPFEPHPHAGFSAVTYVFADSEGGLRSRDSLGNDIRVGPGGIVWTQAGAGVIHQEIADSPDLALHGIQFFVNLSAHNKLNKPEVFWLKKQDIPQWVSDQGDMVQVVVGSYQGLSSPLQPAEPFTLLDATICNKIELPVTAGHFSLIYVEKGSAHVNAEGESIAITSGQAMTLSGHGVVHIQATPLAHVLFLEGIALNDPIVTYGPFIMNDYSQIKSAIQRYESGAMGQLLPL